MKQIDGTSSQLVRILLLFVVCGLVLNINSTVIDCVNRELLVYVDGVAEDGVYSSGRDLTDFPRDTLFDTSTQSW